MRRYTDDVLRAEILCIYGLVKGGFMDMAIETFRILLERYAAEFHKSKVEAV